MLNILKLLPVSMLLASLNSLTSYGFQPDVGDRVIYRLILDGRDQGVAVTDIVKKTGDHTSVRYTQLYIENQEEYFESEIFASRPGASLCS